MTRHWRFSLLILLTLAVGFMAFFLRTKKDIQKSHSSQKMSSKSALGKEKTSRDSPSRLDPEKTFESVASPQERIWEKNLESTLRAQGGSDLKEIDIRPVESVKWKINDHTIDAESVIITLRDQKNEETMFRALVDSQTGKILETWDRPVIDPANPRDNFGIKVDLRYHND